MMKQSYSRPGPKGTSCLTCRRRRKKCDKARPACERCTLGGYDCLGYDFHNEDAVDPGLKRSSKYFESTIMTQKPHDIQPLGAISSATASKDISAVPQEYNSASMSWKPLVALDCSSFAYKNKPLDPAHLDYHTPTDGRFELTCVGSRSPPNWQYQSSNPVYPTETANSLLLYKPTADCYDSSNHISTVVNARSLLSRSISTSISFPQNLSLIPNNLKDVTCFILSQYEQLINMSYINPPPELFSRFRECAKWHLQQSEAIRAPMFIGCKIFESFIDGTGRQKLAYYNRCITRLEQQLHSTSDEGMSTVRSYSRLSGLLEITFLKLMVVGGVNAYQLLQNCAPTFIQLVFTDPSLWPNSSDFTSVSLAHVLAAKHLELARFVLLDSIHSMVYALPQVVAYDTSTPPLPVELNPVEWVHGCPTEFQFALVEINQCYNSLSRVGPETDWRKIEHRIKRWHPKARAEQAEESWKTVARLAIHESWRNTLLIYLYMAVGGVTSDDARVYACVQQVFKLVGTVKHFEIQSKDTHFLVQYLIAGACTPNESQRAKARERLLATSDLSGLWVFRAYELVAVLDDIWHGAAADGRAIRWSDYVCSRQSALTCMM